MKKILLACAQGLSTSMMVERMKNYAKKNNYEVEINALPTMRITDEVIDESDAILLGPQVRYELNKFLDKTKGKIPVEVIEIEDYGKMDGESVLEKILKKI